jgi:hypothetical protein
MDTWHLCTTALTNDDVIATSAVITAIATGALAIFAWKGWILERKKTAEVRQNRDEGVTKANTAIQLMATKSNISREKVPQISVVGDTMYIKTEGEKPLTDPQNRSYP